MNKTTSTKRKVQKPKEKPNALKKGFLYVMICGVVIAALISVIAIIIGEWNDLATKAMLLVLSAVAHAFAALIIISIGATQQTFKDHRGIVSATAFGIVVASFATTALNIFNVLPGCRGGGVTFGLYLWYLGALIASTFVAMILDFADKKDKTTSAVMKFGAATLVVLYVLVFFTIFHEVFYVLPTIFLRFLIALTVVVFSAIVLSVILDRLHLAKHPELSRAAVKSAASSKDSARKPLPAWVIVLIVLAVIFWGLPILSGLLVALLSVGLYF